MEMIQINGIIASILAGLMTGIGGLLIFLKKNYSKNDMNIMLNISAGVMLSASFFSLLMPALKGIMILTTSNLQISFGFVGAMVLGMFVVGIINHLLPHEHEISGHHGSQIQINAAWLFVIAISIHKMPEGLAIGAAYGGINLNNPESLTIGIAIQNIPEGLMVAVTLIAAGYSRIKAFLASLISGMMQPVGAFIGLLMSSIGNLMIPLGMAFAGGAMLFVVINEVLPETYDAKQHKKSAIALFSGFIVMCGLSIIMQ